MAEVVYQGKHTSTGLLMQQLLGAGVARDRLVAVNVRGSAGAFDTVVELAGEPTAEEQAIIDATVAAHG